jgi:ribulose-phosphate 3-epimerase
MSVIVPAILPTSREDLDSKLAQLAGISDEVQVDIVDGHFASPASWPFSGGRQESEALPLIEHAFSHGGGVHIEMDLMVEHPEAEIGPWVQAGSNRITVHAESARHLPQLIEDFKARYGHDKDFAPGLLSFGLAINLSTDFALIEPYLDACDYVQFMGIRTIGRQGESFDRSVLARMSTFRKKHPGMPIQIDGGVSLETAPDLLSAGASRLIVGSALWRAPDLRAEFEKFTALTERYGLFV